MKTLGQIADEYCAARAIGLMLTPDEVLDCAVRAAMHYAAYGNISSISGTDTTPAAGDLPADPPEPLTESFPVKNLNEITEDTVVTVGEWGVMGPLFSLYVELKNAVRMEASRSSGIEAFGRTVSEVQQDITLMETETIPQRAFSHVILTI